MSGDELESEVDSSSDLMMRAQGTTINDTHMLPTPAKTPRKGAELPAQALQSTARVLFPPRADAANELTPTIRERRTRRRKDVANGIDGGGGEKVEIYTDSQERVPELDATEANPFYQPRKRAQQPSQGTSGYATRGNTRRAAELEKALKRDDGMVYTLYVDTAAPFRLRCVANPRLQPWPQVLPQVRRRDRRRRRDPSCDAVIGEASSAVPDRRAEAGAGG